MEGLCNFSMGVAFWLAPDWIFGGSRLLPCWSWLVPGWFSGGSWPADYYLVPEKAQQRVANTVSQNLGFAIFAWKVCAISALGLLFGKSLTGPWVVPA